MNHIAWRFLIEGDKGMAQEQQKPFGAPEVSVFVAMLKMAHICNRDATLGPKGAFVRTNTHFHRAAIDLTPFRAAV